jgi:release factor glutamine methyltransferase
VPDVSAPTIAALVDDARRALAAAGIPEPRREALRICADLSGIEVAAVLLGRHAEAAPAFAQRFGAAVARRAAGEPLAYVTGRAGFRRLVLACDRRALIPRPETELLVELALDRVGEGRAVDVGTGTGCIALSLAAEGRFGEVVAIDRSAGALALAAENRRRTGLRISLVRGDLVSALGSASADLVVSNPPYLTEAEWADLDPSVRDWEPRLALPSGADGLAATIALLEDSRRVVRPGGWLALEVDSTRAATVARRASELGWTAVVVYGDLYGRERYVLARRSEEP